MPITPLFAAIFGLMYLALSVVVINARAKHSVSTGTADNKELEVAVRAHANFIEYVPLSLLLFWFMELVSLSSGLVFWLASALLIGRAAHVLGMNNPQSLKVLRQLGMIITLAVILIASGSLFWWYLPVSI